MPSANAILLPPSGPQTLVPLLLLLLFVLLLLMLPLLILVVRLVAFNRMFLMLRMLP